LEGMMRMIIAKIYKNGVQIDSGIVSGGKKFVEEYPEQRVTIYTDSTKNDDRTYNHGDGITFKEFQDNGNGWEEVYCSEEKIDRTKTDYPLPKWFVEGRNMPLHETKFNEEDDTVDTKHVGYLR